MLRCNFIGSILGRDATTEWPHNHIETAANGGELCSYHKMWSHRIDNGEGKREIENERGQEQRLKNRIERISNRYVMPFAVIITHWYHYEQQQMEQQHWQPLPNSSTIRHRGCVHSRSFPMTGWLPIARNGLRKYRFTHFGIYLPFVRKHDDKHASWAYTTVYIFVVCRAELFCVYAKWWIMQIIMRMHR